MEQMQVAFPSTMEATQVNGGQESEEKSVPV
jgi:hypothetical protein